MAENYFLLPKDEYKRVVNPVNDWVKQTALYAARVTGKPYDACVKHLQKKLQSGEIPFNDPEVIHFERGENGDRYQTSTKLTRYFRNVIDNNEIIAPTMTTYLHPSVMPSYIAEFLDSNVKERSVFKKTSQKYESQGNDALFIYYHQAQDCAKRANNSVSGGFVAEGSVINNKTGHSTLTSVTRSIASLSNASNERLIEGSRHYYSPQVVIDNLLSIASESDLAEIAAVLTQFNLATPTTDDVMACITRSSDLYWRDRKRIADIRTLVDHLFPEERAAFLYTGDLYHLRSLNDAFIRQFITDLARKGSVFPIDEPIKKIYATDEQIVNYAHQICMSLMEGRGKEYDKMPEETLYVLANTCKNIEDTLYKYRAFIKAFFLTKNSPAVIATIPTMIRRSVVLSDTDSTMFSVDTWPMWYFGSLPFTDEGYAVGGAVMFMATQAIAHIIALFSANMNVEKKRLHTLAMKPEFVFPVFAQTSVSKHYYTGTKVKEGNVFPDIKMEIKGVHMKDSSVPGNIIEGAARVMEDNIRTIMRGEKLSLTKVLKQAADVEREIIRSIYAGETQYLKRIIIKEEGGYKQTGDKSPYQHYVFWQEVFAPTHGVSVKPPYTAVRIPLTLPNRTAVKLWLEKMENQEVSARIAKYLTDRNKAKLGVLPIPMEYCTSHGVPNELKPIVDTRKIVLSLTKSYRNTIESMGFYSKSKLLFCEQGY